MAFLVFATAAILAALLWLISRWFRPHFAGRDRVVMHWSFTGEPTSWASPHLALALTPALGTVSLALVASGIVFATPDGERTLAVVALIGIGLVFAAIHATHLWFAQRADR
ncbi:MAG: hypothetical protein J7493_14475 [Porphyrobacter sp.]|nr:hypothetical protein [Porphyrobacter sp.]